MFSKSKTEPTNEAPAVESLADHPAYAEAWGKLMDLRGQRDALKRELSDAENSVRLKSRVSNLDVAARRLLGDSDVAIAEDHHRDVDAIRQDLATVERAAELQAKRTEQAEGIAKRDIAAAVRPQYEKVVAALKQAVINLRVAVEVEHECRNRLRDATAGGGRAGVFSYFPPMALRTVGTEALPVEGLDAWLAELERGYPELSK